MERFSQEAYAARRMWNEHYGNEIGKYKDVVKLSTGSSDDAEDEIGRVLDRMEERVEGFYKGGEENCSNGACATAERIVALRVKGQNRMRRLLCSGVVMQVVEGMTGEDGIEYKKRMMKVYKKQALGELYSTPTTSDCGIVKERCVRQKKKLRVLCLDGNGKVNQQKMEDMFFRMVDAKSLKEMEMAEKMNKMDL